MVVRKSSRGNPWHDELGRFCSGPNGTSQYIVSERTPEEYAKRTEERKAKAFQDISSNQQKSMAKTPEIKNSKSNYVSDGYEQVLSQSDRTALAQKGFFDGNSQTDEWVDNEHHWIGSWYSTDGYELILCSESTLYNRDTHTFKDLNPPRKCVLVAPNGMSCECENVQEAMSVKSNKCPKCGTSMKKMKCSHCGYPGEKKLNWAEHSLASYGQSFRGTPDGKFVIFGDMTCNEVHCIYDANTKETVVIEDLIKAHPNAKIPTHFKGAKIKKGSSYGPSLAGEAIFELGGLFDSIFKAFNNLMGVK